MTVYYARSAFKALRSLYGLDAQNAKLSQVEVWKDYNTGIHGFIGYVLFQSFLLLTDFKLASNTITVEFDDNTATPLQLSVAQTKTSKVWFVTTVYNRPKHFQRYAFILTSLM